MVIMFWRNTAVLILIQLIQPQMIFADPPLTEHRSLKVSRGDSVTLTCNVPLNEGAVFQWSKENVSFHRSIVLSAAIPNLASLKMSIKSDLPTKLTVVNVQEEEEGLYSCTVGDRNGFREITWNLTLSEEVKGTNRSVYSVLRIPIAAGFLLCCVILVVCVHRKYGRRESQ
ncbi:hypothetical protein OJAV_G00203680 [Oryzias javanicus]|uniref:Ig-like domain-containing protein n=1 Tax=Oryzias javanicus TaxID=123683 RepID=A0A3S2NRZ4_ORYJA|nr:hypothetical protein OJAV_G00203680 [Oryzias javanicus]